MPLDSGSRTGEICHELDRPSQQSHLVTTATFTISNEEYAALAISSIIIDGVNSGELTIESDSCSGESLWPTKTCSVTVLFTPTSEGTKSAELKIASNDPMTELNAMGRSELPTTTYMGRPNPTLMSGTMNGPMGCMMVTCREKSRHICA